MVKKKKGNEELYWVFRNNDGEPSCFFGSFPTKEDAEDEMECLTDDADEYSFTVIKGKQLNCTPTENITRFGIEEAE